MHNGIYLSGMVLGVELFVDAGVLSRSQSIQMQRVVAINQSVILTKEKSRTEREVKVSTQVRLCVRLQLTDELKVIVGEELVTLLQIFDGILVKFKLDDHGHELLVEKRFLELVLLKELYDYLVEEL